MHTIGRGDVVAYLTGDRHVPHRAEVLGSSRYKGRVHVRVTWFPANQVTERDVPLNTLVPWMATHEQQQQFAREEARRRRR